MKPMTQPFIFATEITTISPEIVHTRDIQNVADQGITHLRYTAPLGGMWKGPGEYDWSVTDQPLGDMRSLGLTPIITLSHHGLPRWMGDYRNPDVPRLFGEFARDFAARYPYSIYNPIGNTMGAALTVSRHRDPMVSTATSERDFVTVLRNMAMTTLQIMETISTILPATDFIIGDGLTQYHPIAPEAVDAANYGNEEERFLALDLILGHSVGPRAYCFLMDNGMTPEEYRNFMEAKMPIHLRLGAIYYDTSENDVEADGSISGDGSSSLGFADIARQYHRRYALPIFYLDTTDYRFDDRAVTWMGEQFRSILSLRRRGIPVEGFSFPGLHSADGHLRDRGEAYRDLVARWRDALRTREAPTLPFVQP